MIPSTDVGASPEAAAATSITRRQAVGKAAGLLASPHELSNGDRAELRRIAPEAPITPALWKVLLLLEEAGAQVGVGDERSWATLLMGMAFCVSPHENLHDYGTPLGRALADAGWSELRFVRLLRARGETLDVHVRRVAQYLASKSQSADWAHVADLLFYQGGDVAEEIRLGIARSYYRALYAKENE